MSPLSRGSSASSHGIILPEAKGQLPRGQGRAPAPECECGAQATPTCGRPRSSRRTQTCGCRTGTARRPLCRAHTRSPWPGTAGGNSVGLGHGHVSASSSGHSEARDTLGWAASPANPPSGLGLEKSGPRAEAHLAVQLDVLGEERVDLGERAAQAAGMHVQKVLDRVHLVVLHKMLPILELPSPSSRDALHRGGPLPPPTHGRCSGQGPGAHRATSYTRVWAPGVESRSPRKLTGEDGPGPRFLTCAAPRPPLPEAAPPSHTASPHSPRFPRSPPFLLYLVTEFTTPAHNVFFLSSPLERH